MAFAEAFKNAKLKNDMSERPRVNDAGRLVQARRGYGFEDRRNARWN